MAARDEIVWRGGLVYFAIGLLAVAITRAYSYSAICSAGQMGRYE